MHPVISIGLYLLMQLIILALAGWCLAGRQAAWRRKSFKRCAAAVLICWGVLIFLPIGGTVLPEGTLKYFLQRLGNIWLGFNLYFGGLLLLFFCLYQVFYFLFYRGREKTSRHIGPEPAGKAAAGAGSGGLRNTGNADFRNEGTGTGRREAFARGNTRLRTGILIFSFLAALGILLYGTMHAQHTVVNTFEVTCEENAGEHQDMKIVLIGDLHLSVNSHLSTIEKMVDLINAEQPDAVLTAGDIFTSSYKGLRTPDKYAAALRNIRTKYGVFAVYGNHDVEETLFGGFPISPISKAFRSKNMELFFKECGFTVLYDQTVQIADQTVQITGRVDGEKAGDGTAERMSPAEVLAGTDPDKPLIVLQHEPVEFSALKDAGADLVLCGHTHAGQMFPGNLIVPFFNENAYGYKEISGLDTLVTSGIGYYGPPMRLGTDSEIAVIHLHFNGDGVGTAGLTEEGGPADAGAANAAEEAGA